MFVRKCKICGKKFETDDRDQYICPEGHVSKCIICGRDIDIHKSGRPKKYCSTACRVEGRKLDALDHGYKRICELCGKGFYTLQKIKQYVTMFIISLVLYVVNLLSIRIVTKKDVAVANILFLKESKRIKNIWR